MTGLITLALPFVSGKWYRIRRSALERAESEVRSRDFENRFEALIDEAADVVKRPERVEKAAVEALRSSLCGLETQAASADVAAAAIARTYLALLEREGLIADLGQASDGFSNEGSSS